MIILIIILKECCKEHVQSICYYLLAIADKMLIKKIRIINRFKSVVRKREGTGAARSRSLCFVQGDAREAAAL